jgi:hypothetical protein
VVGNDLVRTRHDVTAEACAIGNPYTVLRRRFPHKKQRPAQAYRVQHVRHRIDGFASAAAGWPGFSDGSGRWSMRCGFRVVVLVGCCRQTEAIKKLNAGDYRK